MPDKTRIVVAGADRTGKEALLQRVCEATGGQPLGGDSVAVVLPGGDALHLSRTTLDAAPSHLPQAHALLALVDASAADAAQQLASCMALLSGPAARLPAVLGVSRVDLQPDWSMAGTAAAMAAAGCAVPVVAFDARDATQGMMLLDVLISQIETDHLLPGRGG